MEGIPHRLWSTVLWIAEIRLWQIGAVGIVGFVIFLVFISLRSPGGENTRPEDTSPVKPIPKLDKRLDVFRAEWDIYDRFERWPAVLPLADLCKAAYLESPKAAPVFTEHGLTSVTAINSPFHAQVAYVGYGEDVMVVAFRGTDDFEDWISNVNAYRREMNEGVIHSGFTNAYGTLESSILSEIEKRNPKHLWITGHSLGGAMALICAYDLAVYKKRDISGIISFGQPMIGTKPLTSVLQTKLGDKYVHFVNESDLVPKLPPEFSPFGLLLWFRNGTVHKSDGYFKRLAMQSSNKADDPSLQYEPIEELPPISPEKYREAIQELEDRQIIEPSLPRAAPRDGPMAMSFFPWKRDHSMDAYIEKIKIAVDRASNTLE